MAPQRTLLIPIETKVREFEGKTLLALSAADKGYKVVLGGQHSLHLLADRYPGAIYIDKSVADTKVNWLRHCRESGLYTMAWDEEGLVYFSPEVLRHERINQEALGMTDLFFTWGQAQWDAMLEVPGADPKRMVPSGNARFDMLRPEASKVYQSGVTELQQEYGKIILINTGFPFANHFLSGEERENIHAARRITKDRPEFYENFKAIQADACERFKKMLPELSKRYPEHSIIVRPHPSENRDTWLEIADRHDNMIMRADRNVVEWIMASQIVIHFNCTTAIEAMALGVPAVAYRPSESSDYEQPLPNALSLNAFEKDALFEVVDRVLANPGKPVTTDQQREHFRHHISHCIDDETSASEAIVEAIEKWISEPGSVSRLARPKPAPLQKLWRTWLKHYRRATRRYESSAYNEQKFPGLTLDEVRSLMQKLASANGRFSNIQATQLAEHCFLIEKK